MKTTCDYIMVCLNRGKTFCSKCVNQNQFKSLRNLEVYPLESLSKKEWS
jgi:hypothetical protein